ncbi:phospholipase D-like domain-containing protein [Blastococcus sp. VKM Ac-2987]|uniref:phospholipase D-like domain-containing protein n=1 Tax=Blastococcus sp. VKM Ac-2987 TaxID=3004141 RepID=UPI0022AB9FA5|nr:phospholipase D-like domain-containing protein [Blastococcus sp. VKM Ac-2987]MCZ2857300.1 phospholipase D-like domain-containing protein [Blastococcus sp. VKM Ac-2987]
MPARKAATGDAPAAAGSRAHPVSGGPATSATPRRVLEALVGVPFTEGNRVDVLKDGEQTFPALLAAVAAARRTVDLLWFAWRGGEVSHELAGALADRAREGVRVRVLLDGYGGKHIDRDDLRRLQDAGCTVFFYRPLHTPRFGVWNLRTHRRALICDETVAFTGGTGIDRAWTGDGRHPGSWRDTAFRVEGPAVAGLRSVFVQAWMQAQVRLAGGLVSDDDRFPELTPAGKTAVQVLRPPSQPGWSEAAIAVSALLHSARDHVRITTPYVRLPRWLRELVQGTAERGVRVQLLVGGPHVERPSVHLQGELDFQPLLDSGVEIWRYQPSLLHAKVVSVDGAVAMVGTANFDTRSLALNEQVCLLLDDPAVVSVLDAHFAGDLDDSERVDPERWRARGLRWRALEVASDVVGRPLRGWGAIGLAGRRP